MREVVLDASVVVKWFRSDEELLVEPARALEASYLQGELGISVPTLLFLEVLNAAARRWRWPVARLEELAGHMASYGFWVHDPPLVRVAYWAGQGLTAYDASYVALAEERRTVVITVDERILAVAGRLAEPLVS